MKLYSEQYFDFGTHNYVITFTCLECKILLEGIISKMECWEMAVVTRNLADEVICLYYGANTNRVWSKESGKCTKFGGEMSYSIEGYIRVNNKE